MTPGDYTRCLDTIGWSQRELAQRLGISHNTCARYALGERKIPQEIAAWLRTMADLVGAHPPPRRDPRD